jgi:hypothetical protein
MANSARACKTAHGASPETPARCGTSPEQGGCVSTGGAETTSTDFNCRSESCSQERLDPNTGRSGTWQPAAQAERPPHTSPIQAEIAKTSKRRVCFEQEPDTARSLRQVARCGGKVITDRMGRKATVSMDVASPPRAPSLGEPLHILVRSGSGRLSRYPEPTHMFGS